MRDARGDVGGCREQLDLGDPAPCLPECRSVSCNWGPERDWVFSANDIERVYQTLMCIQVPGEY